MNGPEGVRVDLVCSQLSVDTGMLAGSGHSVDSGLSVETESYSCLGIVEPLGCIDDPRACNRRHLLLDLLVITICAVICGADDWPAVEAFGRAKET